MFGDKTNWSVSQFKSRALKLIRIDNGWHIGAICSHLMSMLGNKGYRMQWDWLQKHRILELEINDYVTTMKKAHEIIRRTGIN